MTLTRRGLTSVLHRLPIRSRPPGDRPLQTQLGGRSGIRTHERVAPLTVFKTVAFVRSAILPAAESSGACLRFEHELDMPPRTLSTTARPHSPPSWHDGKDVHSMQTRSR